MLTVAEKADFTRHGGMIGIVLADETFRFEVNEGALKSASLQANAAMLSLAIGPAGTRDDSDAAEDWSIRQKLVGFATATTAVALLLAGAAMMTYDYSHSARRSSITSRPLRELVGLNSAASLMFEDKEGAAKLLQSLRVKPSIVGACLYRPDGTFSSATSAPTVPLAVHAPGAREDSGVFDDTGFGCSGESCSTASWPAGFLSRIGPGELQSRLASFAWILGSS